MTAPVKLAHVVLRTSRYEEMVAWWCRFLDAKVRHGDGTLSFISYDDEHHRLAIVRMPDLAPAPRSAAGVEHFAFTFASLDDLFDHYERVGNEGVRPYWTINHGMTLSAYYRDPDGNQVETQADSMTMAEAEEFMRGPSFARNPIGIEVDFDGLVARRRAGEPAASVMEYPVDPSR